MDNFENNVEKNSSNKSYVVIIVLLVLIVIGLTGFIIYDKVFTKDEVNNNNNTNIVDNKVENNTDNKTDITENIQNNFSVSQEQADYLFDLFLNSGDYDYRTIDIMRDKKNIISLNDLSNEQIFDILKKSVNYITLNENSGEDGLGQSEVSVESLNNSSLKYFGKKTSLPSTYFVFPANCKLNGDKYLCDNIATGMEAKTTWIYVSTSYSINGSKLIINGVAVYDGVVAYYTDESANTKYCDRSLEACVQKDSSQLTKIAITFNLGNNSYVFDNVKVVK